MRVQQIARDNRRQASRSHEPPLELAVLIDLANILPPKEEPPELFPQSMPLQSVTPEDWLLVSSRIQGLMKDFPRFKKYMKGVDLQQDPPLQAYNRAHYIRQTRDVLRTLASYGRNPTTESLPIGAYLESLVFAKTDDKGRLHVEHTRLLQAIEGVEISRIRLCKICRKIFWAGRADKACCSPKCAGVSRTRKWRERYPEGYKQQRISRLNESEGNCAAAIEQERRALESLKAPTFAKRSARLPKRG
jgi:hypothetical protein